MPVIVRPGAANDRDQVASPPPPNRLLGLSATALCLWAALYVLPHRDTSVRAGKVLLIAERTH